MTAHARPRLTERLAGLFRRRQPDLAYDTSYDHPRRDDEQAESMDPGSRNHPTWIEQPSRPAVSFAEDQPGSGPPWDITAPAAHPPVDPDEPSGWYGLTVIDVPVARTRPYAPEPEFDPEPEPEPVSYPPLSFTADFRDLPVFRLAARKCGLAPAGLVRAGGVTLP